ncbi:MAG: hypothetical protein RIF32_21870 [Leptospirales bacterium]|jgi:hypothetical protein
MKPDRRIKLRRRIRNELGDHRGILLEMADTNRTIRAGNWSQLHQRVRRGLTQFFADSLCEDAQGVERPVYPFASLMQCQRRIARLKRILRQLGENPCETEAARPRAAELVVNDG